MTGSICAPTGHLTRAVFRCRSCKRRRRFIVRMYLWYGPWSTCCTCGFDCGEGAPTRSPRRRTEYAAEAREAWKRAGTTKQACEAMHREFGP